MSETSAPPLVQFQEAVRDRLQRLQSELGFSRQRAVHALAAVLLRGSEQYPTPQQVDEISRLYGFSTEHALIAWMLSQQQASLTVTQLTERITAHDNCTDVVAVDLVELWGQQLHRQRASCTSQCIQLPPPKKRKREKDMVVEVTDAPPAARSCTGSTSFNPSTADKFAHFPDRAEKAVVVESTASPTPTITAMRKRSRSHSPDRDDKVLE